VSSVETPPPVEQQPAARSCPRCGAPMTERQEWCLNCGAAVGTRVVAAPGWRAPIAIAGAILAIAVIAVVIAIVQLADDTNEVSPNQAAAVNATPAPPATTPTPPAATTPAPSATPDQGLPEASGKESPEPTSTPGGGGSADAKWPSGKSGWTVVLASDTSESDARSKAKGFAADRISGVGVLHSDDFSSLKAGYWVVFTGRYDSQSEASDALDGIEAKDAYIRRIEPA
jgi:hypothetical protein